MRSDQSHSLGDSRLESHYQSIRDLGRGRLRIELGMHYHHAAYTPNRGDIDSTIAVASAACRRFTGTDCITAAADQQIPGDERTQGRHFFIDFDWLAMH